MINDTAPRVVGLSSSTVPVSAKTTWTLVRCQLDDGAEGWGEATSFGDEAALEATLKALATEISTSRPRAIGPALALLDGRASSAVRTVVRNALEAALLDAIARRAALPLAVLLGGPCRDAARAYANINRGIEDRSPSGFARAAKDVVTKGGYRAAKIAPFDGYSWDRSPDRAALERGLSRIAAVRDAVGDGVDLLVDCHGRFDVTTAKLVIRETASLRLFWIEEPIDSKRVPAAAQRSLRDEAHRAGTRVAGGEEICSWRELQDVLDVGGLDVILPDLRHTGIRLGLAILDCAVAAGVQASLHNPVGPVLDAASRHVAAAASSFLILERQVGETDLHARICGDVAVEDGCVGLGTGPGLGMTPDPGALAQAQGPAQHRLTFSGMAGAGPDA